MINFYTFHELKRNYFTNYYPPLIKYNIFNLVLSNYLQKPT